MRSPGDQRGLMTLFGYEWPTRVKMREIIKGTVYCWRQRPYNVWRLYSHYSILSLVPTREAAENIGRTDNAVSPTYFNT
jgi:hypothetical protein